MPFSLTDLLFGLLLPALLAGGLITAVSPWGPPKWLDRYVAVWAWMASFCLGYFALNLGPIQPDAHWHWLPYALLPTLVVGPVAEATGISWWDRTGLYALAAFGAAVMLVPQWPDLQPSRAGLICLWGGVMLAVSWGISWLSDQDSSLLLAVVLSGTLLSGSVVLVVSGNLRFAQMAAVGASGLIGIALALRWPATPKRIPGLAPAFAVLSSGLMLVGQANSFTSVPLICYLLIPVAPLLMFPGRGTGAGKKVPAGGAGVIRSLAGPLLACLVAVGWAVAAEYLPKR